MIASLVGDLVALIAAPALLAAAPMPVLLFLDHVQGPFGRYRLTRGYARVAAHVLWGLTRIGGIAVAILAIGIVQRFRR